MSIVSITDKILAEANSIAEATINDANIQSQEIIDEAKKKAENIIAEASNLSKIEGENIKTRKVSAGELQARKMMLASKQEAIKKCFDLALEKLNQMTEKEYMDFLVKEISKIHRDGEIILNEGDRSTIGENLINKVNESNKNVKIVLSNETIKSGKGFILRSGNIEINSTFEAILNSIKDELAIEVANVLFK